MTAAFPSAPPRPRLEPLQPRPLSNKSDTDNSPSPGFQLTGPKTVFSTPIRTDMSLGHLVAEGECASGGGPPPPLYVDWSCFFSPAEEKQRHLTRLRAKGAHLVAHDLACHYPSTPAPLLNQQIPHQTNHRRRSSSVREPPRGDAGVTPFCFYLKKKKNYCPPKARLSLCSLRPN